MMIIGPQDSSIMQMGFAREYTFNANNAKLLRMGFSRAEIAADNPILQIGFARQKNVDTHLLKMGFSRLSPQHKFTFSGSQTQGFGDFDLRVYLDGAPFAMCDLAQTMTITRTENESSICEFSLLPPRERKNPKPIDLYQFYRKKIEIDAVSANQTVRLFSGFVDKVGYEMLMGQIGIRCSDRREKMMNALSDSFIKSIGYTSKSAHGDQFDNPKDELDKRLATVPASLQFDPFGRVQLTAWLPKDVPDAVLSPCVIYQREPSLELAEVGGVVNAVDVQIDLNYPRWIQRSLNLFYNNGLTVCQYAQYGKLANLQNIKDAVSQTGWRLGGFDAQRLEKSGWINCNGTMVGWVRDPTVVNKSDDSSNAAGVQQTTTTLNFDVKEGRFELIRRWTQNITQTFYLRVHNAPSVARYGENKQSTSYSVSANSPENSEWETPDKHSEKLDFTYTETKMESAFFQNQKPVQAAFKAENGDWITDWANTNGDFEQTVQVAYHTAYVQILSSHRNQLNLEVKFMPNVNLSHTHEIVHSHFSGRAKVAQIVHSFNFSTGLGQTSLQYLFFQNQFDDGSGYTPPPSFSRPAVLPENVPTQFSLSKTELPKGVDFDENKHKGMIYQYGVLSGKTVLWTPLKLVINTPEIEQASTDAKQTEHEINAPVNVFNTPAELRL